MFIVLRTGWCDVRDVVPVGTKTFGGTPDRGRGDRGTGESFRYSGVCIVILTRGHPVVTDESFVRPE